MEKLIFLHIPKCGGRSVNTLLKSSYKKFLEMNNMNMLREATEEQLSEYDLIYGHIVYDYVKDLPYRKFTIMRDPVTRTLSQYNHFMHMPTSFDQAQKMRELNFTFQDFITSNQTDIQMWVNAYTTYFGDRDGEHYNPRVFFRRAMDTLLGLDYVGIFEEFDKTVRQIRKKFKLTGNLITTGKTPKEYKTTLTAEDINVAHEVLRPDLTLYQLALQRFGGDQ